MDETEGWFRGLGPPNLCRAFLTHLTPRHTRQPIFEYAINVIPLVTEGIFPDRVSMLEQTLLTKITAVFRHNGGYNPETDYIVLSGDPIAIAVSVVAANTFAEDLVLLRYDSRASRYWPCRVKGSLI